MVSVGMILVFLSLHEPSGIFKLATGYAHDCHPGFTVRLLIVLAALAVTSRLGSGRYAVMCRPGEPQPGMAYDLTVEIARTPEERGSG